MDLMQHVKNELKIEGVSQSEFRQIKHFIQLYLKLSELEQQIVVYLLKNKMNRVDDSFMTEEVKKDIQLILDFANVELKEHRIKKILKLIDFGTLVPLSLDKKQWTWNKKDKLYIHKRQPRLVKSKKGDIFAKNVVLCRTQDNVLLVSPIVKLGEEIIPLTLVPFTDIKDVDNLETVVLDVILGEKGISTTVENIEKLKYIYDLMA